MTNRLGALLIVVLLALPLAGLFCWYRMPAPTTGKQADVKSLPAKKPAAKMAHNNPDVESLSEAELKLLADDLSDPKMPGKSDITRIVHSGETILGDVYEGRPGEFVFSKVTPTIRQLGDGRSVVDIKVNSYSMSVQGEEHKLFTNYPDDTVHVVNAGQVSISHPTPEGSYQMGLVVKVTDAGDSVRLRAISNHHYFKRP